MDFGATLDVDMLSQRARLTENELRLNDLVVRLDGEVGRVGEDLALDFTFDAPSTDFAQVLSLLPSIYAGDFASVEAGGSFSLSGEVDGAYGDEAFPAFSLALSVADGRFGYPDLPVAASAIGADLALTNPGGDLDSTVVDLSRFHVEMGGQPFDAALTLRTPVSDPRRGRPRRGHAGPGRGRASVAPRGRGLDRWDRGRRRQHERPSLGRGQRAVRQGVRFWVPVDAWGDAPRTGARSARRHRRSRAQPDPPDGRAHVLRRAPGQQRHERHGAARQPCSGSPWVSNRFAAPPTSRVTASSSTSGSRTTGVLRFACRPTSISHSMARSPSCPSLALRWRTHAGVPSYETSA